MAKWFYAPKDGNGQQIGPVKTRDLKELARAGKLHPDDLLWKEGMEKWVPVRRTKGLFPEQAAAVPPPLPQPTSLLVREVAAEPSLVVTPDIHDPPSASKGFKAAAQVATKIAQRTKLAQVRLPAAYRELGQRVHKSMTFKEEFPALYANIESLLTKLELLKSTKPAQAISFSEKAKALGVKAKDTAQQKAAEFHLYSAFRQLGEAIYEKHGSESGPDGSVDAIARCLAEIQTLDEQTASLSKSVGEAKLSETPYIVATTVVLFFPLGLYFLWRHPTWTKRTKWIGTACVAGALLVASTTGRRNAEFGSASSLATSESSSVWERGVVSTPFLDQVTFPKQIYENGPDGQKLSQRDDIAEMDGGRFPRLRTGYIDANGTFVQHGVTTIWFERPSSTSKGRLLHELYFKDGKEHGTERKWYDNGTLAGDLTHVDGMLVKGSYQSYQGHKLFSFNLAKDLPPDLTQIDFTKGPDAETLEVHTVFSAKVRGAWVEKIALPDGKGIALKGTVYKDYRGTDIWHGKATWKTTNGESSSPAILEVCAGQIMEGSGEQVFVAGHRHGPCTTWYSSGQKWVDLPFVNNMRNGLATVWQSDGTKWYEVRFLGDKRNGPAKEWHSNGQLAESGDYANDEQVGQWSYSSNDGIKRLSREYVRGNPVFTRGELDVSSLIVAVQSPKVIQKLFSDAYEKMYDSYEHVYSDGLWNRQGDAERRRVRRYWESQCDKLKRQCDRIQRDVAIYKPNTADRRKLDLAQDYGLVHAFEDLLTKYR